MSKIIIVPDVHGRKFWREFCIEENDKAIFLGDYSDPYPDEKISHEDALKELKEIITFKKQYPDNVILLLGNHDYHYLYPSHACSRFSRKYFDDYNKLYSSNKELFQIAYEHEDYLFTHAGLVKGWWEKHIPESYLEASLKETLNKLFENNPEVFGDISYTRGGYCRFASPIWADLRDHFDTTQIETVSQIFGHTQLIKDAVSIGRLNCLDCRKLFVLEGDEIKEYIPE